MPKHSRRSNKGFSLIELLIVVAVILIIAGIAIPNLIRSKMSANEASAVASLRTLNTTLLLYSATYDTLPADLASLGPDTSDGGVLGIATPSAASADLIDSVLAGGTAGAAPAASATVATKSGYLITYVPTVVGGLISTYSITAVPTAPNATGIRTFYTDQTGVIHANASGANPPLATDPPLG
jgi:prepilin-type N-terminal cleavage/methylation domain-containing protein